MAEKKKPNHSSGGVIPFGLEVLFFVVAIFAIWVLMGGVKKHPVEKPFIVPLNDQIYPGRTYGPEDIKNNYQTDSSVQYDTSSNY